MDANLYNTPLTEYPRIPWILWTSPDYPWMPTYIIPPWQSIHGFPDTLDIPGLSVDDSPDTLDIPGLSVDANLYNTPLTEYPRFLDTLDIPGLSVDANLYNTPLAEYPRIPRILPRTIRGCQPI